MKQARKFIFLFFTFLLIIYIALFLFPQAIFAKRVNYKSFIIYSHYKLSKNIFALLDSADNLVSKSELYRNKPMHNRIFLCNSFFEYSFLTPTERYAFASTNSFTKNIILSKCNVLLNRIERNGNENNTRTLSRTIAHEVTHTLIENEIGLLKNIQLDSWKKEGYCDFIAQESSFNFKTGMQYLCSKQAVSSPSFEYFKYRLYVDYLIKYQNLSFNQIVTTEFNLAELDEALEKKYCP